MRKRHNSFLSTLASGHQYHSLSHRFSFSKQLDRQGSHLSSVSIIPISHYNYNRVSEVPTLTNTDTQLKQYFFLQLAIGLELAGCHKSRSRFAYQLLTKPDG